MSWFTRRIAAVTTLLVLVTASAAAQHIRGTVVREDGTTPAAGIVVAAAGADGRVATRVLSSSTGTFDLLLPAAGTYAVSALRIGFRPTVVPDVAVPEAGTVTVHIVLSGGAVSLEAVAVRSTDVCGTSSDPKLQVVRVWTEARTALAEAALWSRESLDAEWITFQRQLTPGSEFVRSQQVRTTRSTTTHAFQSWPADSLATRGYMVPDAKGMFVYYAPDPDVLLSDSFAETHCFHSEPAPPGRAELVGVGFGPQRTRGDRVEIEGTLWIDRASSELRWLEFRYVGLPEPADAAAAGGRVEFLRLPDGPWMVGYWQIRMPITGAPQAQAERGYAVTMLKKGAPALNAVAVSGGMISRVWRRGAPLLTGAGSGIALQLLPSDSTVSVAHAEVRLNGTDYTWRADSTGLVREAPVLDGRYTAKIATVEMLALGAEPVEHVVQVSLSRAQPDSVRVPTARDIVRDVCGADAVKAGTAAMFGTVRESGGRPAAGRAVMLSWAGALSGLGSRRVYLGRTTLGAMTDDAGMWRTCDVPRGKRISIRSHGDDGTAMADTVIPEARWIQSVDLVVSSTVTAAADSGAASIELQVHDAAGMGLNATTLELTAWNGDQRKVTTDSRGRALVAVFPPGQVRMRTKRAEFMGGEVVFAALPGRNTVPVTLNRASLPVVDTVRVIGNQRGSSRMDGFETRRARHEASVSYTADEITKRAPSQLSDLLRSVSSIHVVDSVGVTMAELSRGFTLDRNANAQMCVMRVVLDGVLMPLEAGVNVVRPEEVRGFEVFASASRTPVGLGVSALDAACGLIAIYTGRK